MSDLLKHRGYLGSIHYSKEDKSSMAVWSSFVIWLSTRPKTCSA